VGDVACQHQLPGWRLHFCLLRRNPGFHPDTLRLAIGGTRAVFHGRLAGRGPDELPAVRAVRKLLALDGAAPAGATAVETLARRLVDGEEFPRGDPAEDLCRVLMLQTLVPWSVADFGRLRLPLRFRRGRRGETLCLPEGNLDVADWPVLEDAGRIVGSPASDRPVDPLDDADRVLLTCFQPGDLAAEVAASVHLARYVLMTLAFRFIEERAVSHRPAAA